MQQKKGRKKGKAEGMERYGKFNWVRQGENTEVMFTVGEGNRGVYG
jgi:hypothetical protein